MMSRSALVAIHAAVRADWPLAPRAVPPEVWRELIMADIYRSFFAPIAGCRVAPWDVARIYHLNPVRVVSAYG